MSYIVFARKYRPQGFNEVVGQDHITTTLKNAVMQGRIAHAYLFAGPRGIGKTTTARIFAKALNCEKGPTSEPCNKCTPCVEISQGINLDVLEVDGASNRGIDEIRNLRENVKFSPAKGTFKVYIIDEVHMLTPEAFNALLKTLEEPPGHVKFVFATTQPHKVPATILSRCQRFDFRRIANRNIVEILKSISKKESLKVQEEALALIARFSDGSVRDAEVMLDQLASFGRGEVSTGDVIKMLGAVDGEVLFGLTEAIANRDAALALKRVDQLINDGKDVSHIISSLIGHFRNLAVVKISDDLNNIVEATADDISRLKGQAHHFSTDDILYAIYMLSNTIDFVRKSSIARVPLEAAMVKLCQKTNIASLDEILKKVCELEAKLANSSSPSREIRTPAEPQPSFSTSDKVMSSKDDTSNDIQPKEHAGQRDKAKPYEGVSSHGLTGSQDGTMLDMVRSGWQAILNYIGSKKMSVASFLMAGAPVGFESGKLLIGFPKDFQFHKEALEKTDNKHLIEEAIQEVLKKDLRIAFTTSEHLKASKDMTDDDERTAESATGTMNASKTIGLINEPIVKSAIEVFDAEVTGARRRIPRKSSDERLS